MSKITNIKDRLTGSSHSDDENDDGYIDDYKSSGKIKSSSSYGSYIKAEDGKEYYLFTNEIREWNEKVDDETITDAQFWEWWKEYRDRKHLAPRYTGAWSGKKKDGLSGWWQYDLHSAFGSAYTSATKRLALALRAVQTTVRIVDDSVPPYTVSWASNDNSSTDLVAKRMVINPKPITNPGKLSNADAIDITTGFGLHEASHAKYTKDVHKQLQEPEWLSPRAVAMFLANVIEDVRIERLTSKEYPGFADYFKKALAYMWDEMMSQPELIPKEWGAEKIAEGDPSQLIQALNAIVAWVKWPEEATKQLTHQSFIDERPWWDDWNSRYQTGAIALRPAIIEAMERLKQNEDMKEQMEQQAAAEQAADEMQAAIDAFMKQLGPSCQSDHGDEVLDGEDAKEVDDMVQENLHEWKPKTQHGDKRPTIWVKHPLEDAYSRSQYVGKTSGIVDRLKAVLQFRPELPRFAERLLKEGQLDEQELHRFAMDDYRMFEKQVIETYPNAQVSLLVDMSGSMNSGINGWGGSGPTKVQVAQEIAQLFIGALSTMEGVHPRVFGHTGDLAYEENDDENEGSAEFYHLWEPGEPITRLGLITSMDHGDNFDGYAIEYCVEELLNRGRREDQRLLVVLSDGYPAGHGYGDDEAETHVRAVTDYADRHDVFVLQIAIDQSLRPENQGAMFKNWTPYTSYEELPRQIVRAMSSFLNG